MEDVAEDEGATPHRGFRGVPDMTGAGFSTLSDGAMEISDNAEGDPISRKRNRAEADPEDDTAEALLIDEERRREEY